MAPTSPQPWGSAYGHEVEPTWTVNSPAGISNWTPPHTDREKEEVEKKGGMLGAWGRLEGGR